MKWIQSWYPLLLAVVVIFSLLFYLIVSPLRMTTEKALYLEPVEWKGAPPELRTRQYSGTINTTNVSSMFAPSKTRMNRKVILYLREKGTMPVKESRAWLRKLNFDGCEYSNCVANSSDRFEAIKYADVVFLVYRYHKVIEQTMHITRNAEQLWFVISHESPARQLDKWQSAINEYNGTITYTRDSAIPFPFGEVVAKTSCLSNKIDYTKGKTKTAFAYVSNCASDGYNRLETMRQLAKYIDVDIFGRCTKKGPCKRGYTGCEAKLHSQYRFYLAFENSLCKDYITEKFWKTLNSSGHYVPVAMGGLSVEDYNRVAPPDSFVHAYNFSSIAELGKYLQHLMVDDAAYNKYHQWKGQFYITSDMPKSSMCKLCEVANNPHLLNAEQDKQFADDWNDRASCRNLVT